MNKTITLAEFEKQFKEYYANLDKPTSIDGFMGNWAWYLHARNEFRKKLEEQGVTILK
jgi:hypothetical protein